MFYWQAYAVQWDESFDNKLEGKLLEFYVSFKSNTWQKLIFLYLPCIRPKSAGFEEWFELNLCWLKRAFDSASPHIRIIMSVRRCLEVERFTFFDHWSKSWKSYTSRVNILFHLTWSISSNISFDSAKKALQNDV